MAGVMTPGIRLRRLATRMGHDGTRHWTSQFSRPPQLPRPEPNNMPADVAKSLGANFIVAVDVADWLLFAKQDS